METKKPDPTEELLCEIYRNVQMGTESVADVISKIDDKRLLTDATSEIECYGRYTSEAAGLMNDRGIRPQQLAHGKRMHPIRIIPSHQAVTDLLIDIQPRTPGYENTCVFPVAIEEALEELLPLRIMMQFIKRHDRLHRSRRIQSYRLSDEFLAP